MSLIGRHQHNQRYTVWDNDDAVEHQQKASRGFLLEAFCWSSEGPEHANLELAKFLVVANESTLECLSEFCRCAQRPGGPAGNGVYWIHMFARVTRAEVCRSFITTTVQEESQVTTTRRQRDGYPAATSTQVARADATNDLSKTGNTSWWCSICLTSYTCWLLRSSERESKF